MRREIARMTASCKPSPRYMRLTGYLFHRAVTIMKSFLALCALALLLGATWVSASDGAGGASCRFHADLVQTADLAGVTRLVVSAQAGDLTVSGSKSSTGVEARGRACAPSAALLAAIKLSARRDGSVLYVETQLPDTDGMGGWNWNSPMLDLTVTLPETLPVEVNDSSGDTDVRNVSALQIRDTSGDLTVHDVRGAVEIGDSSGDILVSDTGGDLRITSDSSGDLFIDGVQGNVEITNDSSGDIRVTHVTGNVHVGSDSSGDIVARGVTGNFTVDSDGSGDIDYSDVHGTVTIPEQKRR